MSTETDLGRSGAFAPSGSRPSDGAASTGVSTVPASIPNAMILRVAMAICCHKKGVFSGCSARFPDSPFQICQAHTYDGDAVAALTALRSPNVRMIAAALPRTHNPNEYQKALAAQAVARLGPVEPLGITVAAELVRDWQTMIDEALSPASGIEARSDETRCGSAEGESPVGEAETSNV